MVWTKKHTCSKTKSRVDVFFWIGWPKQEHYLRLWIFMDLSRTSERPQQTFSRKCALCWVIVSIWFLMLGGQVVEMIYESSWKLKLILKRSWDMMIWTWPLLWQVDIDASPKWINKFLGVLFLCVFSISYIYIYVCLFSKNKIPICSYKQTIGVYFDMFLHCHLPGLESDTPAMASR